MELPISRYEMECVLELAYEGAYRIYQETKKCSDSIENAKFQAYWRGVTFRNLELLTDFLHETREYSPIYFNKYDSNNKVIR